MASIVPQTPFNEYTGNGVTTGYGFEFQVFEAGDFEAQINGVVIPSSDYTLSGLGVQAGGTCTFDTAPTSGATVLLSLVIAMSRDTDYQENGDLLAATLDRDFNRIWQRLQISGAETGGSLRLPYPEQADDLPAPADRAGKLIGFDSSGDISLNAPSTGSAAALALLLADPTSAVNGAGLVAFNGALVYTGAPDDTVGGLLYTVFGRTAAEIAAGITPTNYAYVPGHVYRYGTNTTPGTTDMTAAVQATITQAKQTGGADAIWPAATLSVSTVTLDGSGYNVRTAGGRKTILAQRTGTSSTLGQILIVTGSNINIGDLAFTGNIATDTLEFHHCVYCFDDAGAATIKNIHFGDLYGTNIRGDVYYTNALTARPMTGMSVGTIGGANVYRNLATFGGQGVCKAVINDGPVGYRDFDFEPNTGGYQEPDWTIDYAKIGIGQIASQDSTIASTVRIGSLDCDFNRVASTTPAYVSPPGVNAQGMLVTYARYLRIGFLKMRNYNTNPFASTTAVIKSNIYIDHADISNCCVTETTFKSLFADKGTGGIGYLYIGNLIATLFSNTKMCFNGNGMAVHVARGTISGGLLASSIPNGHYENLTVDANSAAGNLIEACTNSFFQNVAFTNGGSATLLRSSTGNTLIGVSGTFSVVEGAACADNRAIASTLSSVRYRGELLSSEAFTKAMADANQTLSAIEAQAWMLITTGALTAQRNLVVPAVQRVYSITNSCTGFGVQVIAATGTGIVVAVGKRAFVQFDGTNVVRVSADV